MREIRSYKDATIVVVDDDDVDVMDINRALETLKIANPVLRARDGIEGLALLRSPELQNRSHIVLLDINMPRMNGLEMLDEMRKDPTLTHAVVFILTTSSDHGDMVAAYKNNVAGYLLKSQMEDGFMRVVQMLDKYWRIVELPS